MFKIEYSIIDSDNFELSFKYKGDLELCMCITGDSLFCNETLPSSWIKLIEEDFFCMSFGDSYGSHVDNGIISIRHNNLDLEFFVDGARGGTIFVKIPIYLCKSEFYKLAKLMLIEYPNAQKIIEERTR